MLIRDTGKEGETAFYQNNVFSFTAAFVARSAVYAALFALSIIAYRTAHAAIINYTAFLSSNNEAPAVFSSASGGAGIVFNTESNLMAWTAGFADFTGPATAAHFHRAPAGVNGPVEIDLDSGINSDGAAFTALITISGTGSSSGLFQGAGLLTGAQATALASGHLYINIHTAANHAGELRGQVLPARVVPVPAAVWLMGAGLLAMHFSIAGKRSTRDPG